MLRNTELRKQFTDAMINDQNVVLKDQEGNAIQVNFLGPKTQHLK